MASHAELKARKQLLPSLTRSQEVVPSHLGKVPGWSPSITISQVGVWMGGGDEGNGGTSHSICQMLACNEGVARFASMLLS